MEAPKPIIKQKEIEIILDKISYNCILMLNENESKIEIEIFTKKNKYKGEISIKELESKIPVYFTLNQNEIYDELCDAKGYKLTNENNLKFEIILNIFKKEKIVEIGLSEVRDIINGKKEKYELLYENIINEKEKIIQQKDNIIKQNEELINEKEKTFQEKDRIIKQKDEVINEKEKTIQQKDNIIKQNEESIKEKNEIIKEKNEIIKEKSNIIIKLEEYIKKMEKEYKINENEIEKKNIKVENNTNLVKEFNIKCIGPINTLKNHTSYIFCFTLLNDGRLVSGSYDKSIIIYNKETFQPDIIIKEHKSDVRCLVQLKNGVLASCSGDRTIKLFNIKNKEYELIQTLNFHSDFIRKVIELSNNYLVSCSYDSTIIFYIKDGLKYKKDYSISASKSVTNIIQTKQYELLYSTDDNTIHFFDLNKRKNISTLENISFDTGGCRTWFCMITKDLLLIPGYNVINIININEYKKIRQIDIPDSNWIFAVCMLNSYTFITGDENKTLRQWKIEGDNLILISKKENAHNDSINVVFNLGNGHIVSGSDVNTIKIW